MFAIFIFVHNVSFSHKLITYTLPINVFNFLPNLSSVTLLPMLLLIVEFYEANKP